MSSQQTARDWLRHVEQCSICAVGPDLDCGLGAALLAAHVVTLQARFPAELGEPHPETLARVADQVDEVAGELGRLWRVGDLVEPAPGELVLYTASFCRVLSGARRATLDALAGFDGFEVMRAHLATGIVNG